MLLFLAGGALLYVLFTHVQERIDIWIDPFADPQGAGYQIIRALYAYGRGGILGTGLGAGLPQVGDVPSIPAIHTDFVFAALAEELGMLGALAVLGLYLVIAERGFRIAATAADDFRALLATGLTLVIVVQAAIIAGGNLRVVPLTGITLPLDQLRRLVAARQRRGHRPAAGAQRPRRRAAAAGRAGRTSSAACGAARPRGRRPDRGGALVSDPRLALQQLRLHLRPRLPDARRVPALPAGDASAPAARRPAACCACRSRWPSATARSPAASSTGRSCRRSALTADPLNPLVLAAARAAPRGTIYDVNGDGPGAATCAGPTASGCASTRISSRRRSSATAARSSARPASSAPTTRS